MPSIFTQIANGKLPGEIVYRDKYCFAVMNIAPRNPGHLLLLPFDEIDHWDQVPADLAAHLFHTAQYLSRVLKRAFDAPRAGLMISGMDVPHLHLHIFPAFVPADFDLTKGTRASEVELAEQAMRIKAVMASID